MEALPVGCVKSIACTGSWGCTRWVYFYLGDKPGDLLNYCVLVSGVVIHWTGSSVGRASSLDNRWSQVRSLSSPIVLTLPRRQETQGGDLDRPQEPQILHDHKEAKLQAGPLVPLPFEVRLHHAPLPREEHG
jgi:hypothetical protein